MASRLGIAYTALYHYFRSRDQLTAEVLLLTLSSREAALGDAVGATRLEVLLDFIRRDLVTDRGHKVQLPPAYGLGAEFRERVLRFRDELVQRIASLIQEGISEGSIRDCNAITTANLVLVLLDAFSRFDDQIVNRARSADPAEVASRIIAVLRSGFLIDRRLPIAPSYALDRGEWLLGIPPGTDPDSDHLDRLMQAASRAFNAEGAGASIPRMAAGLGISKTIFYKHYADKQDLLYHCYLRGIGIVETSNLIATAFGRNSLDQILIHRNNLYRFHESPAGPFPMLTAVDFLRPQQQSVIAARNHGIRQASERRIRAAIEEGFFHAEVDPAIAQPMFGRALYWLPAWHTEHHPQTVMEVEREFGEILFRGLIPISEH